MNLFCHICGEHGYELCEECLGKAVEKAMRSTKDQPFPERCKVAGVLTAKELHKISWIRSDTYRAGWTAGRKMLRKRIREAIRELRIKAAGKYEKNELPSTRE